MIGFGVGYTVGQTASERIEMLHPGLNGGLYAMARRAHAAASHSATEPWTAIVRGLPSGIAQRTMELVMTDNGPRGLDAEVQLHALASAVSTAFALLVARLDKDRPGLQDELRNDIQQVFDTAEKVAPGSPDVHKQIRYFADMLLGGKPI